MGNEEAEVKASAHNQNHRLVGIRDNLYDWKINIEHTGYSGTASRGKESLFRNMD